MLSLWRGVEGAIQSAALGPYFPASSTSFVARPVVNPVARRSYGGLNSSAPIPTFSGIAKALDWIKTPRATPLLGKPGIDQGVTEAIRRASLR